MAPRKGPGRACRAKKRKEETTKTKDEKQKRKLEADAEAMDFSHSGSTTTTPKTHSESWECPLSARRHLTPNSMMVSSRRASLRSAKRLIETGITSMSRCSQPQKLREHSTATDVIQQLHYPVNTTISPCQVLEGSLVASPSRYLRQVAHPFTLAPEMGHEETERGGNSAPPENITADIPEMEEVHEAEKSLPNHSDQMPGQNTFGVECMSVPLEQEHLAEDIQVSNIFVDRANKNHSNSKSTPMVGSPSFSLKLTEIVDMWHDEGDEVNSVTQSSPRDTVCGYQLKPESMPTLRKVFSKYGNIVEKCTVSTMKCRSMLLEIICDIISELEEKDFSKIKEDVLRANMDLVNDIKNMKVDIEWLHRRLVEILEAKQIFSQSGTLKEKRESNRKTIEIAENELKQCEEQKKEVEAKFWSIYDRETVCKETLNKAKDESTRIIATIKDAKSKVQRFLNCSMADGLL